MQITTFLLKQTPRILQIDCGGMFCKPNFDKYDSNNMIQTFPSAFETIIAQSSRQLHSKSKE